MKLERQMKFNKQLEINRTTALENTVR